MECCIEGKLSLYEVERVVFKGEVNCKLWDFICKESENFCQEWREKGISKAGQRGVV